MDELITIPQSLQNENSIQSTGLRGCALPKCEESCQLCQGVTCQTCQNCQGVACQTCQCSTEGGETPTTVICRYDIYKTDAPPPYNYSYSQYTPGVTITVSHPSIAGYSYIGFETNASSYTSTTVVVPNSDFYILLFYNPIGTTVTCTIKRHIEETTETINTESVTAGSSLTLSTYEPSVEDKGLYNFSYALINNTGTHYTTSITVPNSNFTLDYYFEAVSIARIYGTKTVNGSSITQWWPAQPYIYTGSGGTNGWHEATPSIYTSSGWK